jgi:hypothetical protein
LLGAPELLVEAAELVVRLAAILGLKAFLLHLQQVMLDPALALVELLRFVRIVGECEGNTRPPRNAAANRAEMYAFVITLTADRHAIAAMGCVGGPRYRGQEEAGCNHEAHAGKRSKGCAESGVTACLLLGAEREENAVYRPGDYVYLADMPRPLLCRVADADSARNQAGRYQILTLEPLEGPWVSWPGTYLLRFDESVLPAEPSS